MAKRLFSIQPHTGADKEFLIFGPDDFTPIVDYDDVNHKFQDKMARRIVRTLNDSWEGSQYMLEHKPKSEHAKMRECIVRE